VRVLSLPDASSIEFNRNSSHTPNHVGEYMTHRVLMGSLGSSCTFVSDKYIHSLRDSTNKNVIFSGVHFVKRNHFTNSSLKPASGIITITNKLSGLLSIFRVRPAIVNGT
jgi:hypothetical protein